MKSFFDGRPDAAMPALKPLSDKTPLRLPTQSRLTPIGAGRSSKPATVDEHRHLPAVECVKQGDKVTHLIVTCACGERIEIDCLYSGPV